MKEANKKLNSIKYIGFFTILMLCSGLFTRGSTLYANTSATYSDFRNITGQVVDASTGETLIGVNIIVKGTSTGTITDIDGNYSIEADDTDVLVFSYTGYRDVEVVVGNQTTINLSLSTDIAQLSEVVVVGYGTRKKSHNTGAIAQVGGDEVAAIQAARVDDALAGKLPGVLIQNQDGAPGADPKIQIRAASSISGDSNPLIVVDGYPISGSLATVNPNDIQSLEVLKDAASAAIYGSRGANGVILVTTKKGKSGKPNISYNAYLSTSQKARANILKSGPEWAEISRQEIAAGNWNLSQVDPAFVEYRLNAYENSPGAISPEDWLFRQGKSMSHDLSISGGTDDINYFASVGYLNTDGIVITQGFERYNARLNLDAKLGSRFKAGLNINGFIGDRDIVGHDMRDLLRAYGVHPVYHTAESIAFVQQLDQQAQGLGLAPFDNGYRGGDAPFNNSIYTLEPGMTAQDWHYGRANNGIGGSGDAGPATKLDNTERFEKTYFGNVSTYLQFEIAEGLNVKTVLGGDLRDTEDFFSRTLEFDSRARINQTRFDTENTKRSSVLSETTLNYNTVLGGVHDIGAVAGVEYQNFYRNGFTLDGNNVPFGQPLNYALLDPANINVSERKETISRQSVFGRINYAYDNRYLASVSLRRDGDSRFGRNNRFEVFPAFSLGWNVHNEPFFNSGGFLSDLKLRYSYGSLGTTAFLGAYSSLSLLNPTPTIFGNGFLIPSDIANPDLTWQTNTETNYGINLGFLQNRFRIGIDYYTSDIEDILINQSVSEVLGTTSIVLNSGDVTSSGLELELGAFLVNNSNFKWNISANLSTVTTEITDLGGLDELPQAQYGQSGRGPIFRNYVGGEIGEMWGLETTGPVEMRFLEDPTRHPNNDTGESYVVDQNGDGIIDRTKTVEEGGDLVKIGQNTPDFYWGLNSQFNINDIDISLQFQGAQGGEVYNIDPLYYGSQWSGRLIDDFGSDGVANHNGQHYIGNRRQTDSGIQDASYIALRNLTIGYTLSPDMFSKANVGSIRVYVAGTNLLYKMADNYTSYNPEGVEITNGGYLGPTTYGVQVGASPIVRSFTAGVNVNF